MSSARAEQIHTPWFHSPSIRVGDPTVPASMPPDFLPPRPTTGTEDDDDDPADEHADENEASNSEAAA